jgi:maltose alpha-D-glucosyltransferase/alpha-amylase
MTLGPYGFYWLALEPQRLEVPALMAETQAPLPTLKVRGTWENAFKDRYKAGLEERLPAFLQTRRWFGGKARRMQSTTILDAIRVAQPGRVAYLLLVLVEYTDSTLETYALPLTFATGERADTIRQQSPAAVWVGIQGPDKAQGLLYDAMWDEDFSLMLLDAIARRRTYAGAGGELTTSTTRRLRPMLRSAAGALKPSVSSTEQSNTCVFYGDTLVLKLFRRPEPGINPDLEIGRFLTEKRDFPHIPPVVGAIEYRQLHREPMTLAILQGFVPNQGDAWQYTLDVLGRYFEWAAAKASEVEAPPGRQKHLLDDAPPPLAKELIGFYLEQASLLGQRTAEMHLALASDTTDANFAPEPFSHFYQRSQYQGMRSLTTQAFQLLHSRLKDLPEVLQTDAQRVLEMEREVQRRFRAMRDQQFTTMRIRIHGDYHLGQVLYTGKDFVIIDFEGEPARSFSERRNKSSALRDVGSMLRSFHYASFAAAVNHSKSATLVNLAALEPWRRFWYEWVTASFTKGYLTAANDAVFLPKARQELRVLLDAYILDKAVYELGYELNNRPPWVGIPLRGILHIIDARET